MGIQDRDYVRERYRSGVYQPSVHRRWPRFSSHRSRFIAYTAFWITAITLLTSFFQYVLEQQKNPNRGIEAATVGGQPVAVLKRNRQGHYVASGSINGHPVTFMVDTGATAIGIPASVATRIGLKAGTPLAANTAGGVVTVFRTALDSVSLGGITLVNLAGNVNPHMADDTVLLGMTFLKHLNLAQMGDSLMLKPATR